ncbi:MAG: TMEM53 family protein [Myxococcota bacterium]|nr:TMEM53 family protein [Myxococcota bacterium]
MSARARILILGWHGSRERQLRGLARHYESRLGAETMVSAPRSFEAMSRRGGWAREGQRLADRLARAHAERPLPLAIHAFSNAGFWSARALLDTLDPALRAQHRATILDSAPGFPEHVTPRFTAKYASRAMLPGLLAALGLRPAHTHPLFTPPVAALLGLWHLIAPDQVRFMESSLAAMRAAHVGVPLLLVWGDADVLVPAAHVERFADAAAREGVPVERLFFPNGEHVRHLVAQRSAYLAAADAFLARAV